MHCGHKLKNISALLSKAKIYQYNYINLPTRKATTPQMISLSLTPHCRFALKLLSTHAVVLLISQRRLIQLTGKRYMHWRIEGVGQGGLGPPP